MRSRVMNSAVLALLVVGVAGIYLMPRANYTRIAQDIESNRRATDAAITQLRELQALAERSNAAVEQIAHEALEATARLLAFAHQLAARLDRLEASRSAPDTDRAELSLPGPDEVDMKGSLLPSYLDPIDFPDSLEIACSRMSSAGMLAQNDAHDLVVAAIGADLLPYSDISEVPLPLLNDLHDLHGLYRVLVQSVDRRQGAIMTEIATQHRDAGRYTTVDTTIPGAREEERSRRDPRAGVTRHEIVDNGVQRIFHFAFEDYPDLDTAPLLNNAKRHLIRDISAVVGRHFSQE